MRGYHGPEEEDGPWAKGWGRRSGTYFERPVWLISRGLVKMHSLPHIRVPYDPKHPFLSGLIFGGAVFFWVTIIDIIIRGD